ARPVPAQLGPVDLGQVIKDSLALAEVQKWSRGLTFEAELEQGLPACRAEVNRLTQVLLNLLANAGQAMDRGGKITIKSGRLGKDLFISVADTGPGIAPEDLSHIFEPFFTRKEPGQGTGLGLSVSRSIAKSFGGRLEVESRLGQGSGFTLILPVS
ncbi:MAG: ATP-binding protein, partial [Pseudomonadota bacterium]